MHYWKRRIESPARIWQTYLTKYETLGQDNSETFYQLRKGSSKESQSYNSLTLRDMWAKSLDIVPMTFKAVFWRSSKPSHRCNYATKKNHCNRTKSRKRSRRYGPQEIESSCLRLIKLHFRLLKDVQQKDDHGKSRKQSIERTQPFLLAIVPSTVSAGMTSVMVDPSLGFACSNQP